MFALAAANSFLRDSVMPVIAYLLAQYKLTGILTLSA